MKKFTTLSTLLLVALSTPALAQKIYKWTDANGHVQFSDRPPPLDVNAEEHRVFSGRPDAVPAYAVRAAAAAHPVTLYTADNCGTLCDRARTLLQSRGIPFTEVNVGDTPESLEAYRSIFGTPETVPATTVGRQQIKGFADQSWNQLLDQAGYPRKPLPPQ